MDSEIVIKVNEAENSESVESSKESVPPAALEQKKVDEIKNQGEEANNGNATDLIAPEKVEVVEEEDQVKKDGGETSHESESSTTTTTVVVTKRDTEKDDENVQTETETKTTTTTVVVTKKENNEESIETGPESKTVTVVDSKTIQVVNDSKKVEPEPKDPKDTAENQNKCTDSVEQNVSTSANAIEESEESEDEYSEEDEEVEEEKENKTEQKEDAVNPKPNPPEVVNIKNTEIIVDNKVVDSKSDINNQIENIISDIDINIKAQEKISQLKEQELQLIQKQKQLANQIHQQQILAQKLIAENQLKEQELRSQQIQQQQQQQQLDFHNRNLNSEGIVPKASDKYATVYNQQQDDFYNVKESSSRTVDLRKIFTPATDAPQILPKNRKLYASSAFYSPTLHPTVEDQVELARRISHSLSDISNQKSKGQSMYDNRKKRSVKWVHEASGQGEDDPVETNSLCKENEETNLKQQLTKLDKMPLKLIMNPRGQMRDYNSLKESINIETGLLSPDNCAELITALQLHKGRGAELFAKRRRKAENWVVDETNAGTHSPSGIPDYQQYQAKPVTSPNILPAYSDAGKHRVQLNLHQDQLIEKYSKPGVQVVKSPWDAALQTGSASSAFVQDTRYGSQTPIASIASPVHLNQDEIDHLGPVQTHSPRSPTNYGMTMNSVQEPYKNTFDTSFHNQPIQSCNPQRELAYKPSVAQGWGGRNVELPRGLYVPKEISLASYAPPPAQVRDQQFTHNYQDQTKVGASFPVTNTLPSLYSSQIPKQQLNAAQSYQKMPTSSMQAAPQVNFNPSPLPFEKLSKFEESDQRNLGASSQRYPNINKHPGYPAFGSAELENRQTHGNVRSWPASSSVPKKSVGFRPSTQNGGSAQSFNNCARGWNNNSGFQQRPLCPTGQFAPSNSLPYSDF